MAIKHGFSIARRGKEPPPNYSLEKKKGKKQPTHTDTCNIALYVASLFWVKQGQAVKEKDCFPGYLAVKQR